MKIFGTPVFWLETVGVEVLIVEGMRSFEHPGPQVIRKEPQGQALWYLLWLCCHMASSSAASEHHEEVTFTQGDAGSLVKIFLISE